MKSTASPNSAIHVLIADSSPMQSQLLSSALRRRPEFRVRSCTLDAESILRHLAQAQIDVLLLDTGSPGDNSDDMACLRRVQIAFPAVPKILLLETFDREIVVNAFRTGARGLFSFSASSFRSLCKCIEVVYRGEIWASSQQLEYLLEVVTQGPSLRVVNANGKTLITPREEQVVALVAAGLSNRDIARELGLSQHTVKKYLFHIFDKLGISTRVELVLYAVNHGEHRSAEWLPGHA